MVLRVLTASRARSSACPVCAPTALARPLPSECTALHYSATEHTSLQRLHSKKRRVASAALYNPGVATAAPHHSVLQCIAATLRRATAALQRIIAPLLRRRARCNGCVAPPGERGFGAARCAESASVSAESKGWYLRVLGSTRRYSAVLVGTLGYSGVLWGTLECSRSPRGLGGARESTRSLVAVIGSGEPVESRCRCEGMQERHPNAAVIGSGVPSQSRRRCGRGEPSQSRRRCGRGKPSQSRRRCGRGKPSQSRCRSERGEPSQSRRRCVSQCRPGQRRPCQCRPGRCRPGQCRPGQRRPCQCRPGRCRPGQCRSGQCRT